MLWIGEALSVRNHYQHLSGPVVIQIFIRLQQIRARFARLAAKLPVGT